MVMLSSVDIVKTGMPDLNLPIRDNSNGFAVVGVEGTGPVEAEVASSAVAGGDGEFFHSGFVRKRNILLTLRLGGSGKAEHAPFVLRQDIYKYLAPKTPVMLRFNHFIGFNPVIEGVVESVEAPIFTSESFVTVSILCPDPYFRDETERVWQYPTTAYNTITGIGHEINYGGTAPTHYKVVIARNISGTDNDVSEVSIEHFINGGSISSWRWEPNNGPDEHDFAVNNVLEINTTPGQKFVNLLKGANVVSRINGVAPGSTWPMLVPGPQHVRVTVVRPGLADLRPWFYYYPRYVGI